MASDAHAHPADLLQLYPEAENERIHMGIACAASSWSYREFVYHENLAEQASNAAAAPMRLCFGVHPQLLSMDASAVPASFNTLLKLVEDKRLDALGEAGFDLFDDVFRNSEAEQEQLFIQQMELAIGAGLPVVLHVRRAIHKIFSYSSLLSKLPAVLFHSYSGTLEEARSLLRKGINAYFSFGTVLLLNHKRAIRVCAELPAEQLLFETDAPYQPLRGESYSSWHDLPAVISAAAAIRSRAATDHGDAAELEYVSDLNFKKFYSG